MCVYYCLYACVCMCGVVVCVCVGGGGCWTNKTDLAVNPALHKHNLSVYMKGCRLVVWLQLLYIISRFRFVRLI